MTILATRSAGLARQARRVVLEPEDMATSVADFCRIGSRPIEAQDKLAEPKVSDFFASAELELGFIFAVIRVSTVTE